jgi:3-hydroxy acid dehydrogenase / malonic semialdehyde reductase
MEGVADKHVVVTGASSGIGAATLHAFADAGARVVGGARRVDRIAGDGIFLDVTDRTSCERFVEVARARLGPIDVLVNAAGLVLGLDLAWESSEEDERVVLETNVIGAMRLSRLFIPHLRDYGHVVNVGSLAGRQAYPRGSTYITSKFALRGYTYALREDLLGRPIRVSTVDPGIVSTDFSLVRMRGDAERAQSYYADLALGGACRPEDIAACILFAVGMPPHVNVDEIVVKPLMQASTTRFHRAD